MFVLQTIVTVIRDGMDIEVKAVTSWDVGCLGNGIPIAHEGGQPLCVNATAILGERNSFRKTVEVVKQG